MLALGELALLAGLFKAKLLALFFAWIAAKQIGTL
jgi:hypothetical protein